MSLTSPRLALPSEFAFYASQPFQRHRAVFVAKAIFSLCMGRMAPVLLLSAVPIFLMVDDSPIKRSKEDARGGSHPLGSVKLLRAFLEKDSAV